VICRFVLLSAVFRLKMLPKTSFVFNLGVFAVFRSTSSADFRPLLGK